MRVGDLSNEHLGQQLKLQGQFERGATFEVTGWLSKVEHSIWFEEHVTNLKVKLNAQAYLTLRLTADHQVELT